MIWPDSRTFVGIWPYIKLAVPTTIMICLDWWVWELMILMCGYFPEDTRVTQQAAQIVIMNIVALAYMVGIGLETASCTLVGQQIGKGDVKKAKEYYGTIQIVSAIILILTSSAIFVGKEWLVGLFFMFRSESID